MVKTISQSRRGMGKRGQSAVFDAFLFFMILMVASVLTYLVPSTIANHNQELLASQYRDEFVDDTLKAVLRGTINSTSFVKNDDIHYVYDVDVLSAVVIYMELKQEMKTGISCNSTNLRMDIEEEFAIAVPSEYSYSVESTYSAGSFEISDVIAGEEVPKVTKSASTFEVSDGGNILTITLFIWN
jgi:acyl carrier protein